MQLTHKRDELTETVLERIKKMKKQGRGKGALCVADILRHFTVFGYINSGHFGDIYGMGIGKDPYYTKSTVTQATKTRRVPKFVMKIMYDSKLNYEEVKTLRHVNKELTSRTPHIPQYYTHFRCDNTMFRGRAKHGVAKSYEDWDFVKKGKAIILLMEYVGKTMDTFVNVNKNPYLELTLLFQLIYTTHVMQEHNILHGDIYMPNITYMPSGEDENSIWEYKVGSASYMVKVGSIVPMLIDFGQSTPGKTTTKNWSTSDAYMLLRTWSHNTHHEVVRSFIENIQTQIFVGDSEILKKRYTKTSNIIHDFFPMFKKSRSSGGSKSKPAAVWK